MRDNNRLRSVSLRIQLLALVVAGLFCKLYITQRMVKVCLFLFIFLFYFIFFIHSSFGLDISRPILIAIDFETIKLCAAMTQNKVVKCTDRNS